MFPAGAGWEGITSSFLSWFLICNVEVSSSNANCSFDSGFGLGFFLLLFWFGVFICLGVSGLFLYKKETKAEKFPSRVLLCVGAWKRSPAVSSRGSYVWERTTYAEVPASWELAMHFSCKSSPQNGWYLFITQHSIIWERVIQYYRDMLSKYIDACVRSLGDLR